MSFWPALMLFAATFAALNTIASAASGSYGWMLFNGAVAIAAWLMYRSDPRRSR